MVKRQPRADPLDAVFSALADPTRRAGPAADGSESLVSIEFHERDERTELVLTHTEFPASHGPAPYQMGWEGGLDKFEGLFAGSGVDA